MRIAAFNVENLFERPKAMNRTSLEDGNAVLADFAALNKLIGKDRYTAADKARMIELLVRLGLEASDESDFVILRQNRGRLVTRPQAGGLRIEAAGRDDWIGWLDLKKEPVKEVATENTARVIKDVKADIMAVVEAEDRISLKRFNEQVVELVGGKPYAHVMVIDGNDDRGIDVGILTRKDYPILSVASHVDDRQGNQRIFSRDCPEYEIELPGGERFWLLVNHLKSKGYGSPAENNARRRTQAKRVRKLYDQRRAMGAELVAIVGDLNDTPPKDNDAPLWPLLKNGSDLKDAQAFPGCDDGGHPGTYRNGTTSQKIDYLLLSPALFERVTKTGVFRKGVWGNKNGDRWPHYPTMKGENDAASDHAAIWADIDLS